MADRFGKLSTKLIFHPSPLSTLLSVPTLSPTLFQPFYAARSKTVSRVAGWDGPLPHVLRPRLGQGKREVGLSRRPSASRRSVNAIPSDFYTFGSQNDCCSMQHHVN